VKLKMTVKHEFAALFEPTAPIGFFDSGVGGTTVLAEVRALLPNEPLLYLADQARCPYGLHDQATLRSFALDDVRWLLEAGVKIIVVACNTASAAALRWLRSLFPDVLFVGMVPALKPAAQSTRSGVVGVLATPATMQGRLLREVMACLPDGVTVIEQVAPGLVKLIEEGRLEDEAMVILLQSYLDPIIEAGADTLVLGCTHYPFLIPLINKLAAPEASGRQGEGNDTPTDDGASGRQGNIQAPSPYRPLAHSPTRRPPQLTIVDAAPAVAQQVKRVLEKHHLSHPTSEATRTDKGTLTYATTGPVAPYRTLLTRLGVPEGEVILAEGHPAVG
jgi:glutamate racemase